MATTQNSALNIKNVNDSMASLEAIRNVNDKQIQAFIEKHRLLEALKETQARALEFFKDADPELEMELTSDMETDEETLFFHIYTSQSIPDSSKKLVAMFKDWQLNEDPNFYNHVAIINREK